jgi:RNA polymerase sigma factor (sigma-70 family)
MNPIPDCQLLDRWRDASDRGAMDELVRRHIHFVYGAARRQLPAGYDAYAEDVTQAVFLLLIHKSPRVRSDAALAVWLHRAARYAAANARRMLVRQANRDRRAARPEAQVNPSTSTDCEEYRDLLPVLDEAIDRLPERDRSGVVMCFFQRRSYGQIGAVMGITEEAARKRVSRAVDRLREHFAARGLTTSCAALCAILSSESAVAAPATLAGATANLATLSQLAAGVGGASAAASSTTSIMNGVIHTMMMAKVKLAAAACAAIVFGGAVTGAAIHQITAPPPSATVAASATLAMGPFEAKASDKLEAEFLGVNNWGAGGKGWWAIDGSKIDDPRGPFANEGLRARPDTTHQAVLHVRGSDLNGGYSVRIPKATRANLYDLTPSRDEAYLLIPFAVSKDVKSVDIELSLADGEWKTIATAENRPGGMPLGDHETEYGGVVFTHIDEVQGGGSCIYVAHNIKGPQFEVFATDAQGNEHRAGNINGGPVGNFNAIRFDFPIAPDEVTGVVAKVRPYNKKVIAKNVTLDPSNPTKPQIVVEDQPEKK